MRLAGIYVHGALSLIMIFILGIQTGNTFVSLLAAASSGLAYVAEFVYRELYEVRGQVTEFEAKGHMLLVYGSISTGVLAFLIFVSGQWLTP